MVGSAERHFRLYKYVVLGLRVGAVERSVNPAEILHHNGLVLFLPRGVPVLVGKGADGVSSCASPYRSYHLFQLFFIELVCRDIGQKSGIRFHKTVVAGIA